MRIPRYSVLNTRYSVLSTRYSPLALGTISLLPNLRLPQYDLQDFLGEVARGNAFHVGQHDHACAPFRCEQEIGAGALLAAAVAFKTHSIFGECAPTEPVGVLRSIGGFQRSPHQVPSRAAE